MHIDSGTFEFFNIYMKFTSEIVKLPLENFIPLIKCNHTEKRHQTHIERVNVFGHVTNTTNLFIWSFIFHMEKVFFYAAIITMRTGHVCTVPNDMRGDLGKYPNHYVPHFGYVIFFSTLDRAYTCLLLRRLGVYNHIYVCIYLSSIDALITNICEYFCK